jgi:hypothetical protein
MGKRKSIEEQREELARKQRALDVRAAAIEARVAAEHEEG